MSFPYRSHIPLSVTVAPVVTLPTCVCEPRLIKFKSLVPVDAAENGEKKEKGGGAVGVGVRFLRCRAQNAMTVCLWVSSPLITKVAVKTQTQPDPWGFDFMPLTKVHVWHDANNALRLRAGIGVRAGVFRCPAVLMPLRLASLLQWNWSKCSKC